MRTLPAPPLHPSHLHAVRRQPEFLAAMEGLEAENKHDHRAHVQQAFARGAIAMARRAETAKGAENLESHLYSLIGKLHRFNDADAMLHQIGNRTDLTDKEYSRFKKAKRDAIDFNHTLREVINTGANKFGFEELLNFLTYSYSTSGGGDTEVFHQRMKETLIGMRNEVAMEQLLIELGLEYELGGEEADERGADAFIEGVPFDFKANPKQLEGARAHASRIGKNPLLIIWSHIQPADFDGELTIPYRRVPAIAQKVRGDIEVGLESEGVKLLVAA